jgi:hypothetical protein
VNAEVFGGAAGIEPLVGGGLRCGKPDRQALGDEIGELNEKIVDA